MYCKKTASFSGEVFKDSFTDIFYTNLEQIAFSITFPIRNSVKKKSSLFVERAQSSKKPKAKISLDIQIGDYLSSGDKIGKSNNCQRHSIGYKHQRYPVVVSTLCFCLGFGFAKAKLSPLPQRGKGLLDFARTKAVRSSRFVSRGACKRTLLNLSRDNPRLKPVHWPCKYIGFTNFLPKRTLRTPCLFALPPFGGHGKRKSSLVKSKQKLALICNPKVVLLKQNLAVPPNAPKGARGFAKAKLVRAESSPMPLWEKGLPKAVRSFRFAFQRSGNSVNQQRKNRSMAMTPFPFAKQKQSARDAFALQKQGSARTGDKKYKDDENSNTPLMLTSSGRVVMISKNQLVLQKTQPVLFYESAKLHVKKGEFVWQGAPLLTLTHQTLITGDIVQGIPRIEQLFEAFTSPQKGLKDKKRLNVHDTLHSQVRDIFRKNWLKNGLSVAVRKSLEEIGSILLEMIQKVYLSQGVLISDKHIEIIIRQMTSKGQILDSGSTGLLLEEVLPIRQIENANITTPGKKSLYVPSVVGLTAAALTCDSFISAASFQETTRVLSRDAVVGKTDFLRGLKEKVVIGDLISAGTGLEIYFVYTLFSESIAP